MIVYCGVWQKHFLEGTYSLKLLICFLQGCLEPERKLNLITQTKGSKDENGSKRNKNR